MAAPFVWTLLLFAVAEASGDGVCSRSKNGLNTCHEASAGHQNGNSLLQTTRALLSRRVSDESSRGCKFCSCLVTDSVKCGVDTVTDGAVCGFKAVKSGTQCGWEAITDGAKCGWSITKLCDTRRRRRGRRRRALYIPGKVTCSTSKVAKSCNIAKTCDVANTCDVPKSCNVASSFIDCFGEITNALANSAKPYMEYITDTGCTSANTCKNQVQSGIERVVDEFDTGIKNGFDSSMSTVMSKIGSSVDWVDRVYNAGDEVMTKVSAEVMTLVDVIGDYLVGKLPTSQKFDLGSICLPAEYGMWKMNPTDCGAFAKVNKIFSDLTNAEKHFKSAKNKFAKCIAKTGLMSFPTPFFDLAWDTFCLPDIIVSSMEYAIGAVVFAAGKASALFDAIQGIVAQIQDFADNQLGLFEFGREVHQHRLALRQKTNANGNGVASVRGTASGEQCGHQDNWSVDLTLKLVLSSNITGETYWYKFGTGISLGCKAGQLVTPNWIFTIDLGADIEMPSGDTSTGGVAPEFGLSFNDYFPTFTDKVASDCTLWLKPQPGFSIGAAKVVDSTPITVGVCPPEVPSSVSFAVQVKSSAGLAQIGASARAAADAESDSGTGVLGSLTAASQSLASADLRRVLSESALTEEGVSAARGNEARHQEERSRNNRAVPVATEGREQLEKRNEDHVDLMAAVSAKSSERTSFDADFSVSAGASFKFCITPLGCNGQD